VWTDGRSEDDRSLVVGCEKLIGVNCQSNPPTALLNDIVWGRSHGELTYQVFTTIQLLCVDVSGVAAVFVLRGDVSMGLGTAVEAYLLTASRDISFTPPVWHCLIFSAVWFDKWFLCYMSHQMSAHWSSCWFSVHFSSLLNSSRTI